MTGMVLQRQIRHILRMLSRLTSIDYAMILAAIALFWFIAKCAGSGIQDRRTRERTAAVVMTYLVGFLTWAFSVWFIPQVLNIRGETALIIFGVIYAGIPCSILLIKSVYDIIHGRNVVNWMLSKPDKKDGDGHV